MALFFNLILLLRLIQAASGLTAHAPKQWDELSRRECLERISTVTAASTVGLLLPKSARAADGGVPTVRLGNGSLEVTRTIQGYWQLAGGHGKYRENDAIANMEAHFKAGITTLDTADIYGPSEIIMGKFVNTQPKAIPMTKFCCFRYLEEINRAEVRERILKSCERLQVSKLPLVQFFWSRYETNRYIDVALYLTELKEDGLIQEIGATNFDLKRLQELKKAGIPLVSHQVQLSALDRRPVQSGMANWCTENNISLIGFGTVGSGTYDCIGNDPPMRNEDDSVVLLNRYSQ
jgi:aryl-alcohol dehydrogenase-like predicted oxidoreductase